MQVLLQLLELLAIGGSFVLFQTDLVAELLQDLVKAGEADWVLNLKATLLRDVTLDKIFDKKV